MWSFFLRSPKPIWPFYSQPTKESVQLVLSFRLSPKFIKRHFRNCFLNFTFLLVFSPLRQINSISSQIPSNELFQRVKMICRQHNRGWVRNCLEYFHISSNKTLPRSLARYLKKYFTKVWMLLIISLPPLFFSIRLEKNLYIIIFFTIFQA